MTSSATCAQEQVRISKPVPPAVQPTVTSVLAAAAYLQPISPAFPPPGTDLSDSTPHQVNLSSPKNDSIAPLLVTALDTQQRDSLSRVARQTRSSSSSGTPRSSTSSHAVAHTAPSFAISALQKSKGRDSARSSVSDTSHRLEDPSAKVLNAGGELATSEINESHPSSQQQHQLHLQQFQQAPPLQVLQPRLDQHCSAGRNFEIKVTKYCFVTEG